MDIVGVCLILVAGTIRFNTSITARNVRLYDDLYGRSVWLIDEPCFQRQWRPYPRRSQDAFHSLGTHEVAIAHRHKRESAAYLCDRTELNLLYPQLSSIGDSDLSILKNEEVIAINQDPVVGTSVTPFRWGINVRSMTTRWITIFG